MDLVNYCHIMQNIFADTLVESKDEFLQTFLSASNFIGYGCFLCLDQTDWWPQRFISLVLFFFW